jgi:hypothetical protein
MAILYRQTFYVPKRDTQAGPLYFIIIRGAEPGKRMKAKS